MFFTSLSFVVLTLVLWVVYYIRIFRPYQVWMLIAASIYIYWENSGWYTLLLIFSVVTNAILSYRLAHSNAFSVRKWLVTAGVLLNVATLAFFKYGYLFASSLTNNSSGINRFFMSLALPAGISFFTFEGISLLVDTYKKKNAGHTAIMPPTFSQHLQQSSLFISFFPHLFAGPILRANSFFPQIGSKMLRDIDLEYCFRKLVAGYFLKMVVANNLYNFTLALQSPYMEGLSSFTLFTLMAGYLIQLFADFAGYTKIALGIAGLFGYRLDENFNYPFVAASLTEFWRRWHMTLSSFLRYYVYTTWLGNGRRGKTRALFNIFITMVIGGFWHGTQWTFALWGVMHGGGLVAEHFLTKYIRLPRKWMSRSLGWFITLLFITMSLTLFKFATLKDVYIYLSSLLSNYMLPNDNRLVANVLLYAAPVILMHLLYRSHRFSTHTEAIYKRADFALYGIMLFCIITNSGQASSFIYFKF